MNMMPYPHHQRTAELIDSNDLLDINTTDKQESSAAVSEVTRQDATHNIPSDNVLLSGSYHGDLSDEGWLCDYESSTEGLPSRTFKSEKMKKKKKIKERCGLDFLIEACRLVMELENDGVVDDASDMNSSVISK